ncbi:hypothetical protein Ddye_029295 [Dipteronia dyeriana]|uniref:SWIM-type domain-containing protein n=1 Tax=Dipteronia dyeriana TaxID=168575 RepID=A0AAD9WLN9_9ROSI|nr:hypothetical protein Ddye_029295 [Dipteronia dyeriana]
MDYRVLINYGRDYRVLINYGGQWDDLRYVGGDTFVEVVSIHLNFLELQNLVYEFTKFDRTLYDVIISSLVKTDSGRRKYRLQRDSDVRFLLHDQTVVPEIPSRVHVAPSPPPFATVTELVPSTQQLPLRREVSIWDGYCGFPDTCEADEQERVNDNDSYASDGDEIYQPREVLSSPEDDVVDTNIDSDLDGQDVTDTNTEGWNQYTNTEGQNQWYCGTSRRTYDAIPSRWLPFADQYSISSNRTEGSTSKFDLEMDEIKKIHQGTYDTLMSIWPERWSRYQCPGRRCLVKDGKHDRLVDIEHHRCTCRNWDLDQLSCDHVIVVARFTKTNFNSPCHEYYNTSWIQTAYAPTINSVPHPFIWEVPDQVGSVIVLPPNSKRQAGRLKERRTPSAKEVYWQNKCSNCGEQGHNRMRCPNPRWRPNNGQLNTSISVEQPTQSTPMTRRQRACSVCNVLGHNRKTCPLVDHSLPTTGTPTDGDTTNL